MDMHFPGGSVVKNLTANAGDKGSIPGLTRFSGEGNGNPFKYSCLGNPTDREAWQATVHGLAKSWAGLSNRARAYMRARTHTHAIVSILNYIIYFTIASSLH